MKHNKSLYLGADTMANTGYTAHQIPLNGKLWKSGDFIYAYCGSPRMGAILRYNFEPPKRGRLTVDKYLNTIWVDQLMQTFSDSWWIENKDSKAEGGNFIFGYQGRLFTVWSDFQIIEEKQDYIANGSGMETALGSLFATPHLEPKERVRTALKAAAKHTLYVGAPFKIISMEA